MISIFDIYKVTLKHQNAFISDKIAIFAWLKVSLVATCMYGISPPEACRGCRYAAGVQLRCVVAVGP